MNRKMKFTVAVSALLVFVFLLNGIVFAATYQLSGRITDQSGNPLAGTTIDVVDPATGDSVASTTTSGSGSYALSVDEGTYNIRVVPPTGSGFGEAIVLDRTISSETTLNIVLVPTGVVTLSGHVLDPLGNGLANARVYLQSGALNVTDVTDVSGYYEIQTSPSNYDLTLSSDGISPNAPRYYTIRDLNNASKLSLNQSTVLDLVLPAKRVDVHVQDPAGNPVENVHISADPSTFWHSFNLSLGPLTGLEGHSADISTTDATGDATLWLLPASGSYAYNFTATPPAGSPFVKFNIPNVAVSTDSDLAIILQFIHPSPVTTAVLDPPPSSAGTYPEPVTVSLSATAIAGFVVDATYYSVDSGPDLLYSDPFVVSGDGVHTIRYWSVDDFGVYETPKTQTLTIASLQITTGTPLSGGFAGKPNAVTLAATGGRPPYSWSITSGSLPPGMVLDPATGEISGTPTLTGNYSFTAAVADDDGTVVEKAFNLTVESPFTDLSLSSADLSISPANPDPAAPVSIGATIRNPGWIDLSDVVVNFYDFDVLLGQVTIGSLSAGSAVPVSLETTFANSGFRLISVKVDPDDLVVELNENNNEAGQVMKVGMPDFSTAEMVIQATAASTCQGAPVSISGRADYDFSEVPETQDHPVQGGNVTVTVLEPATSEVWNVFTGAKTRVSGDYNQPVLTPDVDGVYPVLVSVTDGTVTGEKQTSLTVSGTCPVIPPGSGGGGGSGGGPSNGEPGSDPGTTADVFLYSEDIIFSLGDENPDPGEEMIIFARVNYVGEDPVFDMPVALNDIYPVGGVLRSFPIDSTQVSFPNAQDSSPQIVSIPWTNTAAGAHIIQAVTDPPFSQFTGNDKATRLIFVGDPPALHINKSASLLVDGDGDGAISPGDTILYIITYENQGSSDVTGAVITDEYDETLLQTPSQISNSGAVADGVITWNLGTLAAGATGSVTYEVAVIPETEFPSGTTSIINHAFLSAEDVPTVGTTYRIDVVLNQPPEVSIDGPFTVDEGGSVTLTATGSDPDGDTLTYAWDLDDDGIFEASGQGVPFTADDGPASHTVAVQVTDPSGLIATAQTTVSVLNVAPTADFSPGGDVNEGSDINLSLTNPSDPSSADTAAGFEYAFDCGDGNDYGIFGPSNTAACPTSDNEDRTVKGKIRDKDGGETEYTASVIVNNVYPTVTELNLDDEIINENDWVSLTGTLDDPGADTHTVVIDWGDGDSDSISITGERDFFASHQYLDDNPTGTPSDEYLIQVTVTDDDLGSGNGNTTLTVNNVAPVVSPITAPVVPVGVGTPIAVSAGFSDVGTLDTHTAVWDWGDNSASAGTVSETNGSGSVANSHTYIEPGVYTIRLVVTDDDIGEGESIFQFVVVYDPAGSFVTGGGWIWSPAGAYYADPSLEGKANFGFVSKYKKGADTPIGQTEFQFYVADLNFHSDSYDWLVVAGHKAMFKGVGTINGAGNYGFLISAIDEKLTPSTDVDLFRIKIWDKDNGDVIVYDNLLGAEDDADPTTEIGGGNIVIHD